jgi:hypothetical protein
MVSVYAVIAAIRTSVLRWFAKPVGCVCSSNFPLPWSKTQEPYIRIATGDYPQLHRECGRDNALVSYLTSLSHEVLHYRQWVETGDSSERGVVARATGLVRRYAKSVDRP